MKIKEAHYYLKEKYADDSNFDSLRSLEVKKNKFLNPFSPHNPTASLRFDIREDESSKETGECVPDVREGEKSHTEEPQYRR